jgi:hypothetical protein
MIIITNKMLKFHNYKHYRLPITINPLEYGKLIYQNINFFVIYMNTRNLALVDQHELHNQVKIYTNGELIFEYKDHKIDDNTFIRSIDENKFTFKNNKLIEVNKIVRGFKIILVIFIVYIIFPEDSTNIALATISGKNIIKLRKTKNIHV